MRVLLRFRYDGTAFCGWQVQPGLPTVQGEIESALGKLCGRPCRIHGAGRTDAGVHSLAMPSHLDIREGELPGVRGGLNGLLPRSVSCLSVETVPDDFHARFHALSRSYVYRIGRTPDPLRRLYEYQPGHPRLELGPMKKAAELSIGTNSWRGFSKEGSGNATWEMTVSAADVTECPLGWEFTITANRFLRGVVRIWAGTVLRAGTGRIPPETVTEILGTGTRTCAGPSLPPCGLTLTEVLYPHDL